MHFPKRANEVLLFFLFLAARIQECLESVGLPVYVLSNAGKASIKNLTELASNLQIKDVTKSRYLFVNIFCFV